MNSEEDLPRSSYELARHQANGWIQVAALLLIIIVIVAAGACLLGGIRSQFQSGPVKDGHEPQASSATATQQATPMGSSSATARGSSISWRTYVDTNYGYSIMYPDDWVVYGVHGDGNPVMHTLNMGKGSKHGFTYGGQSILISVALNQGTNQQFLMSRIAPASSIITIDSITINGIAGERLRFSQDSSADTDNSAIFFSRKGRRYVLVKNHSNRQLFKDYGLQIDKVISTFTFLP